MSENAAGATDAGHAERRDRSSDRAAAPGRPDGPGPAVTVIVPVHNTRRYLDRSLGSVFTQTLDPDRIEIIAVDDGSTDGSAAWLDAAAAEHPRLTVVHQPPSGGAGKPRNVGLDRATGDYVFFLDSDDHLGPEALERMVAMAEEHGSDIVHGRIVGAGGRGAPVDLRTTSPRVSVFDSPVYWTLAAYKLFRRAFLERHRLRFVEGRLLAEDLPFGIAALLRAGTVSVVADHDCYYLHGRPDDSNASRQDVDWPDYLDYIGTVLAGLADEVPPGPDRDRLMVRHFHGEILMPFAAPYLARDEAGRRAMREAARPLVDRYLTDRVLTALPPRLRLRAHCLRTGLAAELAAVVHADTGPGPVPIRVENGRAYAAYPTFRTPVGAVPDGPEDAVRPLPDGPQDSVRPLPDGPDVPLRPLPDGLHDLTDRVAVRQRLDRVEWVGGVLHLHGTAALPPLGPATAELVLHRAGAHLRVPADTAPDGSWHAALDPAAAAAGRPLADGVWGLKIAVTAYGDAGPAGTEENGGGPAGPGEARPGLRREAWLVPEGGASATDTTARVISHGPEGPTVAALFLSTPHGHLHLDLDHDGARRPLGTDLHGEATRTRTGRATVDARLTLPGCPADAALQLVLRDATRTVALRTTVERAAGDRYRTCSRLRGGPPGTWQVALRLTAGTLRRELPVRTRGGRRTLRLTVPGDGGP
ncbi:glycosyltransferase family 2 protein [Streptomyces sp. NRRL F-4489]|uniref:glycosyltransferase family 2 protein n=1 Tax=Streptomyces sp. NRRL F-4489 TaxID=1609095 RepID=UPI00099E21D7|nr:glycosyltransferase [Streptomyces sp. NRRL F-4489]